LGAGVALGAVTAAGPSATAQELEWATRAGGADSDVGAGIATDSAGNSYVTGDFEGAATFGAGGDNETVLRDAGGGEIFVAKYDRNGQLLWAMQAGGTGSAHGSAIATDGHGNSYITGSLNGTATFGAGEDNETVLRAGDAESEMFVAKYDRDGGRLLWATRAGGADIDVGAGIATDSAGNSYVTGTFNGTATFGAGEDNETVLRDAGGGEIFFAKYDRSGRLLWAMQAGGTGSAHGSAIATDGHGNSYITASFNGTATFGAGEDNETVLRAGDAESEMFVAKYDRDGRLLWATQASSIRVDEEDDSEGYASGSGIATDPRGHSYVTGTLLFGPVTFGPGGDNETVLRDAGGGEIFVAKYDRNGQLLWAMQAGGTGSAHGSAIATDGHGNSYITASFNGTATFGAGEDNETVLRAGDAESEMFVAKYDRDGRLLWATQEVTLYDDIGVRSRGIATDPRGNSYVTGQFDGRATFSAGEDDETLFEAMGSDVFVAKYAR
jgi:hypothetical protein